MKRSLAIALLATMVPALPALAVPGGEIGTLAKGYYACELPGSAAGPSRIRVPQDDFSVIGASNYVAREKRGSYLLTGKHAIMTSGPLNGARFRVVSDTFLRSVDRNGKDQPLRCIRTHRDRS